MSDPQIIYSNLTNWGSSVRIAINGHVTILQALVIKRVLTTTEAIAILDDMATSAAGQSTTNDAQKQIAAASFDQARELLRQTEAK